MKKTYDVIIVGAGIIGLSIAYYLSKRGGARVLVLEKEESWISGSTPRANGGFRQQFSTRANIRMSQLSLPVFESFEEEFGVDIGFRQDGYLFLTATADGAAGLRHNFDLQRSHNVPVEALSVVEVATRLPFLHTADLVAASFCSEDGCADPYSIALGFGQEAKRLGVRLELNREVAGVETEDSRVTGVRTAQGVIQAPCVVNAAGPAAARLASSVGLELPVEPIRRMLVMTEEFPEIPEDIPMTVDIDSGFLMRKESGRVLMGWSDPDEPPGFNLAFDPNMIDMVAAKAIARVPCLERVRINPRKCWAGLYAVTPDHHCILGEAPGVEGFFLANGFSGHGMMHSPAVGMILADLICAGRTDLIDVGELGLSRFAEGRLIKETVVL